MNNSFIELLQAERMPRKISICIDDIVYFVQAESGNPYNTCIFLNTGGAGYIVPVIEDYETVKMKLGMAITPPPKDEPLV